MDDWKVFVLIAVLVCLVAFVILPLGITTCGYYYETRISMANRVVVTVDGKEVYRGISAYENSVSMGSATHVIIYCRLWPWQVQEREYVSNNVKVMPE